MEELLLLIKSNPSEAIKKLLAQQKDSAVIDNYIKEYYKNDRTIRDTQVGKIQKDKTVGKGEKSRLVKSNKISIPFQKKIVRIANAFEVGEPATLIPNNKKLSLVEDVNTVWENNRIDAAIQKLVKIKKVETEAALLFAIRDIDPEGIFNKLLGKLGLNQKKEIRCSILQNKNGRMAPYFDGNGDMIFFTWSFVEKVNDKDVNNTWIYDAKKVYMISDKTGSLAFDGSLDHGFSKIPVVYVSQDDPEWFDAISPIDRYEVSLSKLGASNDYSGHPILLLTGEVEVAPDKDEDGKVLRIPVKIDENGNVIKGEASFLTSENAPESVKLEMNTLNDDIHSITSTPDISFNNVKGIGTVSGVALKLLFLDAMIKAKDNEGENRTMYQRILNVIISGIITTVNVGLKKDAPKLYYTVQFNSIIPDDLKEASDIVKTLIDAGVISKRTAIEYLGMNPDVDSEIEMIKNDSVTTETKPV